MVQAHQWKHPASFLWPTQTNPLKTIGATSPSSAPLCMQCSALGRTWPTLYPHYAVSSRILQTHITELRNESFGIYDLHKIMDCATKESYSRHQPTRTPTGQMTKTRGDPLADLYST